MLPRAVPRMGANALMVCTYLRLDFPRMKLNSFASCYRLLKKHGTLAPSLDKLGIGLSIFNELTLMGS